MNLQKLEKNIANLKINRFKNPLISFVNALSFTIKTNKTYFYIKDNKVIKQHINLLLKERFFDRIETLGDVIKVYMKKDQRWSAHMQKISLISKPSRVIYIKVNQIKEYKRANINSILVLSTNIGIITDVEALSLNIGGMLLYSIK